MLRKLSQIEDGLRKEIRGAGEQILNMNGKITEIIDALKFNTAEVEELKKETIPRIEKELLENKKELQKEVERLQVYVARENLVFHGIKEEEREDTQEVVRRFLREKMKLDEQEVDNFEFQRCHRVFGAVKPRAIKVRVLRFPDKLTIMANAFNLRGTRSAVTDDLPLSVRRARKAQLEVLKEAKKAGMKASFSRQDPTKLYIEGKHLERKDQHRFLEKLKAPDQ